MSRMRQPLPCFGDSVLYSSAYRTKVVEAVFADSATAITCGAMAVRAGVGVQSRLLTTNATRVRKIACQPLNRVSCTRIRASNRSELRSRGHCGLAILGFHQNRPSFGYGRKEGQSRLQQEGSEVWRLGRTFESLLIIFDGLGLGGNLFGEGISPLSTRFHLHRLQRPYSAKDVL